MQKRYIFKIMMIAVVIAMLASACQSTAGTSDKPTEVVIGVYEPMTGQQAAGGQLTMQGVNLAYE